MHFDDSCSPSWGCFNCTVVRFIKGIGNRFDTKEIFISLQVGISRRWWKDFAFCWNIASENASGENPLCLQLLFVMYSAQAMIDCFNWGDCWISLWGGLEGGHGLKLGQERSGLGIWSYFSMERAVQSGGGVPIPGGISKLWGCGTWGQGVVVETLLFFVDSKNLTRDLKFHEWAEECWWVSLSSLPSFG